MICTEKTNTRDQYSNPKRNKPYIFFNRLEIALLMPKDSRVGN